jgi:hypothetical protein
MSDGIRASVSGDQQINAWLAELPPGLDEAAIEAINQTVRQYGPRLSALVADAAGVPKSVLSGRKRIQRRLAKKGNPLGVLWAGLNPIPAEEAGKTPADYDRAFYWGPRIFQRVEGAPRLPVRRVYHPLADAAGSVAGLEGDIAQSLKDNFEKALGNA